MLFQEKEVAFLSKIAQKQRALLYRPNLKKQHVTCFIYMMILLILQGYLLKVL